MMKRLSVFFIAFLCFISCSQKTNYLNSFFQNWLLVENAITEQKSVLETAEYEHFVSEFNNMCNSDDFSNYRSIYFDDDNNFFLDYVSEVKAGIESGNIESIRHAVNTFELISKRQNDKASKYYLNIIIILAVFFFFVLIFLFFVMQKYNEELDSSEQMGIYAAFVMNSVERERRRISQDIHDTVLQDIRLIKLQADNLNHQFSDTELKTEISSISELSQKSIDGLRSICHNLTSSELKNVTDENSLITAVRNLCEKFQEQNKITCKFSIQNNIEIKEIDIKKSMHIFRIIQEALNNVQKHAEASYVSVVLKTNESENHLIIYITDDGKGFDVENYKRDKHFGISNMKERAKIIGATILIQSDFDAGTEIKLII